MTKRPPSALWLAHKPVGATSASLVDAYRARFAGDYTLKVSHGGALDPFAEGLMVLLVGAANRLFERLHEVPKVYRAEVVWGAETDTCDAGGAVTWRGDMGAQAGVGPTPAALEGALDRFVGWTEQVPPHTSNKRVDGERAYVRAHRGEAFTLPAQRVYCHSARWLAHDLPRASTLELAVRGGFYVRSLARDLGRALGVGAHLRALQRDAIGPWRCPAPGAMVSVTGTDVMPWLPLLELTDAEWGAVRRGAALPERPPLAPTWPLPAGFPAPAWVRAAHLGRLVALQPRALAPRGAAPSDGARAVLLPGGV
ncbi:MAG: tRNA pseudouridine(55) synthase [Planctomycetota bacterium]